MTTRNGPSEMKVQRLTTERLGDILEAEPRAIARFNDDMRVIGVDLPLPDGMTDTTGSADTQHRTALFGDRVGRDRFGQWLVFPA